MSIADIAIAGSGLFLGFILGWLAAGWMLA